MKQQGVNALKSYSKLCKRGQFTSFEFRMIDNKSREKLSLKFFCLFRVSVAEEKITQNS